MLPGALRARARIDGMTVSGESGSRVNSRAASRANTHPRSP